MQGKLLWEKIRPYIGFLGVAEGHRRRGIGSELIREAERGAFAVTGAGSIYLECEHENEKALRLYHKLGLTRVNPDEIQKTLGGPLSKNSGLYRAERKSLE